MRWTNCLVVVLGVVLSGCASQNHIIPDNERDMLSIYRDALHGESRQGRLIFEDEVTSICKALLERSAYGRCQRKVRHILSQHRLSVSDNPDSNSLDYHVYSRDAKSEISQLFPRLPNPDLVVYVYPHLATRARAPIPGYASVIPLYERVEYQLPGEAVLKK